MGIIKNILEYFRPIYMEDPFFGRIQFYEGVCWETSAVFKPLDEDVDIAIDADEKGPVEADRELYREIERRYETLLEAILDVIIKQAKEEGFWRPECSRESLRKELHIDWLSIERDEGDAQWEITFWVNCIGLRATLLFRNWKVEQVLLEG